MEKENICTADEQLTNSNCTVDEDDEEEEALSLCDLPIKADNQSAKEEAESAQPTQTEDDFDFSPSVGSVLAESEMCAADDIFFRGQILPLRHSVSSDGGFCSASGGILHRRCLSRSESMERFHSGVHASVSSSRSSSHNSSSSTTSSVPSKPRVRNRFHSHPSPSPQIRIPSSRPGKLGRNSQKSSIWRFLQVGVVRTPGIELQDLKIRGGKSSGSHNSSTSNGDSVAGASDSVPEKRKKPPALRLLAGCRCTVKAVETVDSRMAIVRKEEEEREDSTERREKRPQNGKHAISRRRTFEWLKELSLIGDPD